MEQNAPGRPYIAGAHLEGPCFCDGMRGAQNPDYIKAPDPKEYTALCDAGKVSRISFAPELEGPSVLGPRKEGVDCFVKNGVAYLSDMTAFAGSIATADRLLRTVYKQADVPLTDGVKMLTSTPARVMGLADRGSFKCGNAADVVLFDENINIKALFLQGKQF